MGKKMTVSHIKIKYKIIVSIISAALLVLILYFAIKPTPPEKPEAISLGDYSYAINFTDYEIKRLMKKHDLPSVVVSMFDDKDIIYKQAYGLSNIEQNTKATLDTVYKVGSITKLFTGIEVMRMYEEGLIDIDNPITDYLPGFTINSRFKESADITIKSMLSHRSGLPRGGTISNWHWDAHPDVLKAQADSLSRAYMVYPVGYRYKYSNVSYNVLGYLIEVMRGITPPSDDVASGWPYYMKDNLLTPLGMDDSSFGSSMLLYGTIPTRDVAMGYIQENGKNIEINQFDIINLASGIMQSTMNDMIKFGQHILNIDEENPGIISGKTLNLMFEPQNIKPADPQTNGLTWFTDSELLGEKVVFHSGTNQGTISIIMLMPERDLGFIVFSNSDSFQDVQNLLAIDILKLMFETKYGIKPVENQTPATIDVDEKVLEKYVGSYVVNGEIIDIIKKSGNLKAVYQKQKIKMLPISETKFILSSALADVSGITFEFFTDVPDEEDVLIVTMGDHFVCPKYPTVDIIPSMWENLIGSYEIHPRTKSDYDGDDALTVIEIFEDNNILKASNEMILYPYNEDNIVIVGGIFDGETMTYDKNTGDITWQSFIYKPVDD